MSAAGLPNLSEALAKANLTLVEKGYQVVCTNEKIEPKSPVYLQLKYTDGKTRNIGITHLARLEGANWDDKPFEELARTTDEVTAAILARITLFFDAKARGLYITEDGTIFDFKQVEHSVNDDKTFLVNGKLVTFNNKPIAISRIKSEGIIEFKKLENGHYELEDAIDRREAKGMFIDNDGKIYRA